MAPFIHTPSQRDRQSRKTVSFAPSIARCEVSKLAKIQKRKSSTVTKEQWNSNSLHIRHQPLQLQRLELVRRALLRKPSVSNVFDSLFQSVAPNSYLAPAFNLSFACGARRDSKSESILQIFSKYAKISETATARASSLWPRNIGTFRQFNNEILAADFQLVLPIDSGSSNDSFMESSNDIYRTDFERSIFLGRMPSWAHRIILKADPENLINRLLPAEVIPWGARHIAACFWSFLCVVDDMTEDGDCFNCIEACVESLSTITTLSGLSVKILALCEPRDLSERSKLDDCKTILSAFHNVVSTTRLSSKDSMSNISVIEAWKVDFWLEVLSVIKALQAEKKLHGKQFSMREWLRLRIITISARPFMVLVRASLGLPATLEVAVSPRINQMQILVQAVLGLQNDLLGWEKDHQENNPLNAVEVLIRQGVPKEFAFSETLSAHNETVLLLLCLSELDSTSLALNSLKGSWTQYIGLIVSFCKAMAEWMLSSRRYRTEQVVVPGLMRLMYHEPNSRQ